MEDLNQFGISKTLGSKIKHGGQVGFGNFSSLSTTEEIQKALRGDGQPVNLPSFTYEEDAVVVRAFEDIRDGAPTDELLWNKDLAAAFISRCRELGLDAPGSYFIRRLINARKNSPRYREQALRFNQRPRRRSIRASSPITLMSSSSRWSNFVIATVRR